MEFSPKLAISLILFGLLAIATGNLILSKVSEFQESKSPAPKTFLLGVMAGVLLSIVAIVLVSVGEDIAVFSRTIIALVAILVLLLLLLRYVS